MIQSEELNETEIDATALAPELRAIGNPEGVPIVIDGETWLLAHGGVAAVLDPFRNRMDDQARIQGKVNMSDVFDAASVMLMSNYELTALETVSLLAVADHKALVEAVMGAMFGDPNGHRTYSEWLVCSFYANGLDPEKVPAGWIPLVLEYLEKLRRVVPISQYTDAGIAAPRLQAAKARCEAYKAKQAELQAQQAAMAAPAPVEQPGAEPS
jgi:hypothetical protein